MSMKRAGKTFSYPWLLFTNYSTLNRLLKEIDGEAIFFVLQSGPNGHFGKAGHVRRPVSQDRQILVIWKWRRVSQLMLHNLPPIL